MTLTQYFPQLSEKQIQQFEAMQALYEDWNVKINVISRKDMDNFYERHLLHSLAIGKVIQFKTKTKIVDVGTGGGFPSVPLAILFPEVEIHAIDSIGKKIKVVGEVSKALGLQNLTFEQVRSEDLKQKFDFVVSRAVAEMATFYNQTKHLLNRNSANDLSNGFLCLKGGDLIAEFADFRHYYKFYDIKDFFEGEFFETKKVVYVNASK
jgi:16S rRNA (guanine527-N7)-methyltransferase